MTVNHKFELKLASDMLSAQTAAYVSAQRLRWIQEKAEM